MKSALEQSVEIISNQTARDKEISQQVTTEYVRLVKLQTMWEQEIVPVTGVQFPQLRNEDTRTHPTLSLLKNIVIANNAMMAALTHTAQELKLVVSEMDASLEMSLSSFRTAQASQSRFGKAQSFPDNSTSLHQATRPETPPPSVVLGTRNDSPLASDQDMAKSSADKDGSKTKKNGTGSKKPTSTLGSLLSGAAPNPTKK